MPIGSRAFAVLGVLIDQPGDPRLERRDHERGLAGVAVEESNLTVQISTLRRLLDAGEAQGGCIQTVPGRGYRFVGSVTAAELPPVPAAPDSPRPISRSAMARMPGAGLEPIVPPPSYPAILPSAPVSRWPQARRRLAIISAVAGLAILLLAAYLFAGAFGWIVRESAAPPLSLVVLLFTDLSAARDQQYFADAVTADLTADLSRISGAFVISSNTAFTYRGRQVDSRAIGRELGVRYVVDGSIRRAGEQVRATVELIDAETDAHLWSERFDSEHGDLLALQNAITARIGNTLNVELTRAVASRPLADRPNVRDLILRGRAAVLNGQSRATHADAIGFFEQALALDPNSWEAQARLAGELIGRNGNGFVDTEAADIARAKELIRQARAAAPRELIVRHVTGHLLRFQGRYEEAITEYEAVLAINPNSPYAISQIGRCKYRLGLLAETIPLQEQAIRLSPRDPSLVHFFFRIAESHLLQGHVDKAINWLEKARSAHPTMPFVHMWLASAYALRGRLEEAAMELAEARRLIGDGSYASIAQIARPRIKREPKLQPFYEATLYAGLRAAGLPEE